VAGTCKRIRKFQFPEAALNLLTTKVSIGLSWKRVSCNFSKFVSGRQWIWQLVSVCYAEKHLTCRNTWSPKGSASPFTTTFVSYCSHHVFSSIPA